MTLKSLIKLCAQANNHETQRLIAKLCIKQRRVTYVSQFELEMMDEIKMMAAEAALRKMVSGNYFDICTIDNIIKMLELIPDRTVYSVLKSQHCVHYNQMPDRLLKQLPELIAAVLASPAFDASRINLVSASGGLRLVSNK